MRVSGKGTEKPKSKKCNEKGKFPLVKNCKRGSFTIHRGLFFWEGDQDRPPAASPGGQGEESSPEGGRRDADTGRQQPGPRARPGESRPGHTRGGCGESGAGARERGAGGM